jgi:DNA-binding Lrp family transcriptional regulator
MDAVDKQIIRVLQGDLPIVERPFAKIAHRIGIQEEELLRRIGNLIREGIIRKFGLRIDSRKVGYASTLVAMRVSREKLDDAAGKLNSIPTVTHNYARDHEYNLWFTIIAKDKEELQKTLEKIKKEVEHEDMINLPTHRKFKIKVKFNVR